MSPLVNPLAPQADSPAGPAGGKGRLVVHPVRQLPMDHDRAARAVAALAALLIPHTRRQQAAGRRPS